MANIIDKYVRLRGGNLVNNIILFSRLLKDLGVYITPGMTIDVCKGLKYVDILNKDEFYYTLRANLTYNIDEIRIFDKVFNIFWNKPMDMESEESAGEEDEDSPEIESEKEDKMLSLEEWADDEKEEDLEKETMMSYSPVEVLKGKDFSALEPDEIDIIRDEISKIVHKIPTIKSRRMKPDPKGKKIDLRTTLRKNMKYGDEIIEITRKKYKIRKPDIVLLCDVSGSMDCYSKFLIQFMYAFQNELNNMETFVFSTKLSRVTDLLKKKNIDKALKEISEKILDWAGGTNIGLSIHVFNRDYAKRVVGPRTIIFIMSDGWDRGDTILLEREMEKLHKMAYRIIWLNPLMSSPSYEPICKGMKAALPHIDSLYPLYNLKTLASLEKFLHKII
jgi:hypothetical protein